jgi:hypothetical protein
MLSKILYALNDIPLAIPSNGTVRNAKPKQNNFTPFRGIYGQGEIGLKKELGGLS